MDEIIISKGISGYRVVFGDKEFYCSGYQQLFIILKKLLMKDDKKLDEAISRGKKIRSEQIKKTVIK